MNFKTLNICQVSLARDIPLILKNFENFKKFYKTIKIYIICSRKEMEEFKKKINFIEFQFIVEEEVISFEEFYKIFDKESLLINYKKEIIERLKWYYQQVLKLAFVIDFIDKKKENIIIWDSDTVILKKIKFFKKDYSIKYGTLFEFHKPYFLTNQNITGILPKYFISSLVQFISLSKLECEYLKKKIQEIHGEDKNLGKWLTKIIFKSIFKEHKVYNGSMFSEYELIGSSNYLLKKSKQKPIFNLRFGLNGILTKEQLFIAKIFNVYHVTYEHSHLNKNSKGMLYRKQSWLNFFKIIFKNLIKFILRNIRHNYNYYIIDKHIEF